MTNPVARCAGITRTLKPCRRRAEPDGYCASHKPEEQWRVLFDFLRPLPSTAIRAFRDALPNDCIPPLFGPEGPGEAALVAARQREALEEILDGVDEHRLELVKDMVAARAGVAARKGQPFDTAAEVRRALRIAVDSRLELEDEEAAQ